LSVQTSNWITLSTSILGLLNGWWRILNILQRKEVADIIRDHQDIMTVLREAFGIKEFSWLDIEFFLLEIRVKFWFFVHTAFVWKSTIIFKSLFRCFLFAFEAEWILDAAFLILVQMICKLLPFWFLFKTLLDIVDRHLSQIADVDEPDLGVLVAWYPHHDRRLLSFAQPNRWNAIKYV
jgi:hypothetical protein